MSKFVGATDSDIDQANFFQRQMMNKGHAPDLPSWVKCMYCGTRPTWGNLLGEVVNHSSALACQNCMKERGKIFGMNAGMIQDLGAKIGSPEGEKDDSTLST